MHKKILLCATVFLFTHIAVAAPPAVNFPLPGATPAAPKALSPTEFQNKVTTIDQQDQAKFNQQLNDRLAKTPAPNIPALPVQQPGPQTPGSSNPAAANPYGSTKPAPSPSPPQIKENIPPPPEQAPPATPPQQPENPYSSENAPQQAPQQQQSEVYTGFGNSKNNPPSSQKDTNQKSGGWNIKY